MITISLTKGYEAIIDEEDFEKVKGRSWHVRMIRGKPYAGTGSYLGKIDGKYVTRTIHLHRIIIGNFDSNIQIDHINGNGLDNRKANLRIATSSQNRRNLSRLKSNNTSGFRGVTKHGNGWRARISAGNGKKITLGTFKNCIDAARAFDKAALELYGEFCGKLNFEDK